jgi:hypothetical protein
MGEQPYKAISPRTNRFYLLRLIMRLNEAIRRLRMEIGDPPIPFKANYIGDGMTTDYDLPKQNIDTNNFTVVIVTNSSVTSLQRNVDYYIDDHQGFLSLVNAVPFGSTITVSGQAWGLFTDRELKTFINDSVLQHCHGRTVKERQRTYRGFISYRETPMSLDNLPPIEESLLIDLCTINTLWTLANDASTDTDIVTAEGTNVDRLGRYRQLIGHIAELQERYERYCGQLNVGAFRTVSVKLRRKSYTTGRYVPVFQDREFDDARWPLRELPGIDVDDADNSGIPSPLWGSYPSY